MKNAEGRLRPGFPQCLLRKFSNVPFPRSDVDRHEMATPGRFQLSLELLSIDSLTGFGDLIG